tara:strand:- start:391 stop:741 length:351 start_codon:yes stop_codon:yes gene_type:complete
MMKHLILIVATLCSFSVFGQNNLTGTWDTGEDNTVIEITKSAVITSGKIKSSDNPKATIGKVMLKDLKKSGSSWKGKIYAAKRQEWYDAVLTRKGNILEIEISVGFFSKTIEWNKV